MTLFQDRSGVLIQTSHFLLEKVNQVALVCIALSLKGMLSYAMMLAMMLWGFSSLTVASETDDPFLTCFQERQLELST